MPKIAVEIEWDWPNEPEWLNADNVALALHAHCKNTKFVVRDVELSDKVEPGDDEILVFTTQKPPEKMVEISESDYDALCQRLPERVVSEIHQAIGQASVCWEHLDSAASFDSEQASSIARDLCNFIADFLLEINQKEEQDVTT